MRVLVLTPYLYGTTPGPRSLFERWEGVLGDAGITLDYAVFETERLHELIGQTGRTAAKAAEMLRSYRRLISDIDGFDGHDAVFVNREAALIGPALVERWAVRRHMPLIYLLDDPLYIPYRSPSNGYLSYLKFFGKVKTLCRISSTVIVNSPFHREFAERYNRNVWEIPNSFDPDVYDGWKKRSPADGRVCVGWSGSATTVPNLQVIRAPLRHIAARDDVRLRLIGATEFGLPEIPHEAISWRAETEVQDLRPLEVGLVPLPVNEWNKRKFYMKVVQYMGVGIVPVATPLGANPTVIKHGETGFLVDGDDEWKATLGRLVDDSELRERIGRNAAEEAHRRFTVQANAERIVAAFRSAVS